MYGSATSFLLIFNVKNDLVRFHANRMLRSAKTLTLTSSLDDFGTLTSLPCHFSAKMDHFWAIPSHERWTTSKKKGSSPLICRLLVERKNIPLGILKNGGD